MKRSIQFTENKTDSEMSKKYTDNSDFSNVHVARELTTVETEIEKHAVQAHEIVDHLPKISVENYIPSTLKDALFVGHLVTDLDSIGGSIGAAELYGGIACRASEINSETKFALEYWGVEQPPKIEDLINEHPKAGVCLVDHQQTSQLNPAIPTSRIVGVIDHHALQNATIVTELPIYIDIRPWGSMSTIIAHNFFTFNRRPTRSTAGLLLCAILSDTLNLKGPTTTEWDRLMVSALVEITGVTDIEELVSKQFKAKSHELKDMTAHQLCNGDQKVFKYDSANFNGSVGFAVIETTDDEVIMDRSEELLQTLQSDKKAKGLDCLFLAVVNIVELRTNLLLLSEKEKSLAVASFKNGKLVNDGIMDLGNLVSRKKDFIPAIAAAVKEGWGL